MIVVLHCERIQGDACRHLPCGLFDRGREGLKVKVHEWYWWFCGVRVFAEVDANLVLEGGRGGGGGEIERGGREWGRRGGRGGREWGGWKEGG